MRALVLKAHQNFAGMRHEISITLNKKTENIF